NLVCDHGCAADEAGNSATNDIAKMLEREDGVRLNVSDLPSKLPEKLQQRPGISRPARPAINGVGRCVERLRLAEEEQVMDLVAEVAQPGAGEPGNLLGARVLCLGLDEKDTPALDVHFVLRCVR